MNTLIRNVLALIVGFLVGSVVNMAIIIVGPMLIPPPEGVDATSMESLAATMHLYEPKHFIAPFFAHALGAFSGAIIAFKVAASHKSLFAYLVAALFLFGGAYMIFVIPSPLWFTLLDLIVAYIPMAWLAILMGRKINGTQ